MNKQAVNTFKEGLVMDLNPLANDNKSLTNALNATFITLNGNELMLQNDMGNGRINRVRLDDGYIPVGIKEYGGIIYIASYNPKNGKGLIGSFPYPKLEWELLDFLNNTFVLDLIYGGGTIVAENNSGCIFNLYEILNDSVKIPLLIDSYTGNQIKIRPGDSFSIKFNRDTVKFLNSKFINIKLIVKTSSSYYVISENKIDILKLELPTNFVYGGNYSGYLYLQIDLIIPNKFEVDYIYREDSPNSYIRVYPKAYNSLYTDLISNKAVVLTVNINDEYEKTNLDCNDESLDFIEIINSEEIQYLIYPVTDDGGYIKNLGVKINSFDPSIDKRVTLFKYTINNNTIKLLFEYQDIGYSTYDNFGNIQYIYRFYNIKGISNINNINLLLNPDLEITKDGYHTLSGIRYLETNLLQDNIYLCTISAKYYNELGQYIEKELFYRFIYGTERYNEYYDKIDDFNNINEDTVKINYNLGTSIFECTKNYIKNYHKDSQSKAWILSKSVAKYSEEEFKETDIPDAFMSEILLCLSKTTEPYIECIPDTDYKYILDNDVFNIPNDLIKVKITEVHDEPLKFSNKLLYTNPNQNSTYELLGEDSLLFYRYISSLNHDSIVLLDRYIKSLAPIFDPYNIQEDLLAWDYSRDSIDCIICAKKFLSNSADRLLHPYLESGISGSVSVSGRSFLDNEESLTTSSVRLSNLQSAILTHSEYKTGNSTPSIFDIFSGGCSAKNPDDFDDKALEASLKIERNMNSNKNAGIKSNSAHGHDEINSEDDWMIATCLNIKGKPMPINLASLCSNYVYDSGTFVGDYISGNGTQNTVTSNDQSKYPQIDDMSLYSYINVAKKILFLLSQIFTVQNLLKNIYLVGPSSSSINYNIQDPSYIKYTCNIIDSNDASKNYTFTFEIDNILNKLSNLAIDLSINESLKAKNYISSILSNTMTNSYNYGHLVNLGSNLFDNILLQYLDCYDNEEIIDLSLNYSDECIYYLSPNAILNDGLLYSKNTSNNELWENSGINFNSDYHCFYYNLDKFNTDKYVKLSSSSNNSETLFDWTGSEWTLKPLDKYFETVFKSLRDNSNVLSGLTNNYIVLKATNTNIKTRWTLGTDSTGPGIVYIDFGLRGLCKGNINQDLVNVLGLQSRMASIINRDVHLYLIDNGFYSN